MSDNITETLRTPSYPRASGREAASGLMLAFSGARPPEQRRLPPGGLQLGRKAQVFGAGPLLDPQMSRRHASIARADGAWWLSDLDSRNGTFCNGERVAAPARLSPGDVIQVGDTVLLFEKLGESPAPDAPLRGASVQLAEIRQAIAAVAPYPHAVLVLGETGTGKEVVAQQIHAHSGRSGALVPINCAALHEGVIESELFGHARGAFTGAGGARTGLIEAASRGTLFFDELGELPLALQGKLLRVLETGRIRPVGASHEVDVDVRVVAATNRDLIEMVQASTFRADLYARLAQWTIQLPPLRQRPADIPHLARFFLAQLGAADRPIAAPLGVALLRHPWPLNARELRNVLAAALVDIPRGPLTLSPAIQAALHSTRALSAAPAAAPPAAAPAAPPTAAALSAALTASRGSVAAAARALSASRQQVYRWMKLHQLQASDFR